MKKLIVSMIALCNIVSLVAMEKQSLIPITKEENERFVFHAQIAVNYSNKAVTDNKITSNNALHIITNKYPEFLKLADNSLAEMIVKQDLSSRLEEFKIFETDETVKATKNILLVNAEDKEAKKALAEQRKLLAGMRLEEKQPTFSRPKPGEVQTDARINFMVRNKDYSLDDAAVKDYIAVLIYQYILAQRITIYDETK